MPNRRAEGYFVSGRETLASNLPTMGNAVFNGDVLGLYTEDDGVNVQKVEGDISINIDFAQRELTSGSMTNLTKNGVSWISQVTIAPSDLIEGAVIGGEVDPSALISSEISSSQYDGHLMGTFMGDTGESVAGSWNLVETNYEHSASNPFRERAGGVFVASKQGN